MSFTSSSTKESGLPCGAANPTALGWYFVAETRRIAANALPNGRPAPHSWTIVAPGQTLRVEGRPAPGKWGLHASESPCDALFWAHGTIVCRVRLGGEIAGGAGKLAATERTTLWMADAANAVWRWACDCAEWHIEAQTNSAAEEAICRRAVAARRLWLENRRAGAEAFNEIQGPVRNLSRKSCGNRAAALCMNLVISNWKSHRHIAARPRGWGQTARGAAERKRFEEYLNALSTV